MRSPHFAVLIVSVARLPAKVLAQGETTGAIVGQLRDITNPCRVPPDELTIANSGTGLRRGARADDGVRIRFHSSALPSGVSATFCGGLIGSRSNR